MSVEKSVTITSHFQVIENICLLKETWSDFCERILDAVVNSALGIAKHNTLSDRQVTALSYRIDNLITCKSAWNIKQDDVLFEYNWVREHIPFKSWEEQTRDDFMADALKAMKLHITSDEL